MKNLFWIAAATLLLAACGGDEPAAPATEAPVVAEQPTVEEAETPTADESTAEEEVLEVVEESAAEPEPEEQAILLAQADTPAPVRDWKYSEGKHYQRLMPAQPTVGGADKIEVAEFFWYGCPHCYDFEPYVNKWDQEKPAGVRFVRIPAMWNNMLKLHAQIYYTQEVLARNGVIKDGPAFHDAVFVAYHQQNNRLMSEAAIQKLFARFGVSADEFARTWGSFEVAQKLRVGEDLARRYSIANVPTMVVNGKYRAGGAEAGSYTNLIELIDELVARESAR